MPLTCLRLSLRPNSNSLLKCIYLFSVEWGLVGNNNLLSQLSGTLTLISYDYLKTLCAILFCSYLQMLIYLYH